MFGLKLTIDLKTLTNYNQIVKRYPKSFLVIFSKNIVCLWIVKYTFIMEVKAAYNLFEL
jgi:hypothetical protein